MGDVPEMSKQLIRGLVGEERGTLYIKLGGLWHIFGERRGCSKPIIFNYSFKEIVEVNISNGLNYTWKDSQMDFSKRPAIREFSYEQLS